MSTSYSLLVQASLDFSHHSPRFHSLILFWKTLWKPQRTEMCSGMFVPRIQCEFCRFWVLVVRLKLTRDSESHTSVMWLANTHSKGLWKGHMCTSLSWSITFTQNVHFIVICWLVMITEESVTVFWESKEASVGFWLPRFFQRITGFLWPMWQKGFSAKNRYVIYLEQIRSTLPYNN